MLRILSLNYEYPPIGGGGGNAHQHLLHALAKNRDLDVTLVVPTLEPAFQETPITDQCRVLALPIEKQERLYWRRGEVIRYLWRHYRFLTKHLRDHQYDVCHAFFGFPTGVLAWWFGKRFPTILSVRGSDVPGYNKRFTLDHKILRPLMKRVYGDATYVVANSGGLRDLYESQFPGYTASVIPNGIDPERFRPRERSGNPPTSVITVARLIPRKGIDLLLHACKAARDAGTHIECHIVGEGPQLEPLRQLSGELGIAEQVVFHGGLSREAIAEELPKHDAFVLPSYAEGMSNAALEAMACGLSLLLTDTGGSAELIEGNGAIVPTGDRGALTQTLLEWFANPEPCALMGQRSRERARQFSWDEVARQYTEMYFKAANR